MNSRRRLLLAFPSLLAFPAGLATCVTPKRSDALDYAASMREYRRVLRKYEESLPSQADVSASEDKGV